MSHRPRWLWSPLVRRALTFFPSIAPPSRCLEQMCGDRKERCRVLSAFVRFCRDLSESVAICLILSWFGREVTCPEIASLRLTVVSPSNACGLQMIAEWENRGRALGEDSESLRRTVGETGRIPGEHWESTGRK